MITESCKYRHHESMRESYEDKYERRQEKHENLRRRNNITICRLVAKHQSKEPKEVLQSPRQKEFFRRRNLIIEEQRKKEVRSPPCIKASLVLENKMEDFAEVSWNNPTSQLSSSNSAQHSFSDGFAHSNFSSCGIFPKTMTNVKVSKICKGTQTRNEPNAVKNNSSQQTDCGIAILDKEIIQLSGYLKEALHRELLLKKKLTVLQDLLAMLLQAAEKSWKGQINEDQLKSRVCVLENQLQTSTQSYSNRSLKKILLEMEDQKQNYEQKAKESLLKLLEEKLQAEQQLQNAQRALTVAEDDCSLWKEHYNTLKQDWSRLTNKHVELENKLHVLDNKLQWSGAQNAQLNQALQNLESERVALCSKMDALQEDSRLAMEHVSAMEDRLQTEERQKLALEETIKRLHNRDISMNSQVFNPARDRPSVLSKDHKGAKVNSLQDQLQERTSQFTAKEEECRDLHCELEVLSHEYRSCLIKLQQCRDELNQRKPVQRRHDHWIPLLMVVMAAAMVAYLANFIP
ncbi:TRAF3-interacting JNK-activating modulator [Eublepharis macularius]|uniref:TRAF3-interacting JNK-activating modulator n=1 Tax=Eublepharis macularius TaxID=481883 RepID=A0AA97KZ88_EUBMA|nr:TRAF3-interacting JNK-activating modulator [Eublepharis macularius]